MRRGRGGEVGLDGEEEIEEVIESIQSLGPETERGRTVEEPGGQNGPFMWLGGQKD